MRANSRRALPQPPFDHPGPSCRSAPGCTSMRSRIMGAGTQQHIADGFGPRWAASVSGTGMAHGTRWPGHGVAAGTMAAKETGPMLELRAGRLRCGLIPSWAAASRPSFDGHPVLRSTPAAQLASARQAGSHPLVPFSNRIGYPTRLGGDPASPIRNNGDDPRDQGAVAARPGACWTAIPQLGDAVLRASPRCLSALGIRLRAHPAPEPRP